MGVAILDGLCDLDVILVSSCLKVLNFGSYLVPGLQ